MITSVIETSADEIAIQIDRCRWVVVDHTGEARTEALVWGSEMVSGTDYEKEMNDLTEDHDGYVDDLRSEHAQELEEVERKAREQTLNDVLDALFEYPEATAALEAAMKGKA